MSAKRTGRQNMIILVVLLAAQLFLMSGSVRGAKGAATIERSLMRVSSPVVGLAEMVGGSVGGAAGGVRELLAARSRNQILESNVRRLSGELRYYREDARQLHNRLVGEFQQVLDLMAERLRNEDCEPRISKVVSFRN